MQKKHIITGALATAVLALGAYIFWPENSLPVENTSDAEDQSAKIMDRLADKFPIIANSSIDTRTIINGIKVPPAPDPKIDKQTIAGVDVNSNGVRDSLERIIAERLGDNPEAYGWAMVHTTARQKAMLSGSRNDVRDSWRVAECAFERLQKDKVWKKVGDLQYDALDTPERGKAFSQAFVGSGNTGGPFDCKAYEFKQ